MSRSWLQWLGDLPGRFGDALSRAPGELGGADLSVDALAVLASASARANGYLSLEPGLRQFHTDDGLLTWAAQGRTAFAVGGIHATGDAAALLRDYLAALRAARYKRALLFPVTTEERATVAAAGLDSILVGAEAFLTRGDFSLRGRARADLRQMLNRGRKRYGLVSREVDGVAEADGLLPIYDHWLASKPASHRMYLVIGSTCFSRPAARRYFAVSQGEGGPPVAFATMTPGWGGAGWGVDVMARDPAAPAGAMEVLLTDVVERLFDEGVQRFSLGASPMVEKTPVPPPDRPLLRFVFRRLYRGWLGNRLFRFRSLAHFKDKFVPRWEPVHIAASPRVSVSSLYAGCRMWGLFGPPRLD